MDYMKTQRFIALDDSALDYRAFESMSKRVFTKAAYEEQSAEIIRKVGKTVLFTGAQFGIGFPDDYFLRSARQAFSILRLFEQLSSIAKDSDKDLTEAFIEHGNIERSEEFYRGAVSATVSESNGVLVAALEFELGYFYAEWLVNQIKDSGLVEPKSFEDLGAIITLECSVTDEDGKPADDLDWRHMNVFEDTLRNYKAIFKTTAAGVPEGVDQKLVFDFMLRALLHIGLAQVHLSGIRTQIDFHGKLFRRPRTPLAQAWFAFFDESKSMRTGICKTCGNPWIAKRERIRCDKCSSWSRSEMNKNRKRTIY